MTMRRYWVTLDDTEEPQEEPSEVEQEELNTPTGGGECTGFDPMSLFGSKEEAANTPTEYEETTSFDPMSMFGGEQ